jgi:hypothetical protein
MARSVLIYVGSYKYIQRPSTAQSVSEILTRPTSSQVTHICFRQNDLKEIHVFNILLVNQTHSANPTSVNVQIGRTFITVLGTVP